MKYVTLYFKTFGETLVGMVVFFLISASLIALVYLPMALSFKLFGDLGLALGVLFVIACCPPIMVVFEEYKRDKAESDI